MRLALRASAQRLAPTQLLPIRGLTSDGVLVRSDGALVRLLDVVPTNPLALDAAGCERMTDGLTDLLLRVPAGMSVQLYAQGVPLSLEQLAAQARRETEPVIRALLASADHATRARGAALRALAEIQEESLSTHAHDQAAMDVRFVLAVPLLPAQSSASWLRGAALANRGGVKLASFEARARDSLTLTEQLRSALAPHGIRATLMDAADVADLLWQRCAPLTARTLPEQRPSRHRLAKVLSRGEPADDDGTPAALSSLLDLILQGSVDLRDAHRVGVDGDLEQTFYVASRPERTFYGWLLHAMQSPKPWALSVHVHMLDAPAIRGAYRRQERRVAGVNQGAYDSGRRPDRDQLRQEHELQRLLDEDLASGAQRICDVSIYQCLREPGPQPDPYELEAGLVEAMRALAGPVDARVGRGTYQQPYLWRSTLPLGLDVARKTFRAITRNAADCTPFVSTRSGSPRGLPLGFAQPGRTLERLDPFDPLHDNAVTLLFAKSGAGKTATVISLITAALTRGAQITVLDRSRGHYAFATELVPGAAHIEPVADDASGPVINPWDTPDLAAVPRSKVAFLVRLHALLIGDHHAATDAYGLTSLQRSLLASAIREVYGQAASGISPPCESSLRDVLLAQAEQEADRQGGHETISVLRSLAQQLGEFCGAGTYGPLLDRPTTVDADDSPLLVLNTQRVPDDLSTAVVFIALEHTMARVERRFAAQLQRRAHGTTPASAFDGASVVVLEEVWKLVRHRATREWVVEQAKRARHLGLWLIAITQQRTDLEDQEANALLVNSSVQILMRLGADELRHASETLELSREERAQVARLTTEKGAYAEAYMLNGERGRGAVTVRHGARLYWLTTSEPHEDLPRRAQALREAGHDEASDDVERAAAAFAALDRLAAPSGYDG